MSWWPSFEDCNRILGSFLPDGTFVPPDFIADNNQDDQDNDDGDD